MKKLPFFLLLLLIGCQQATTPKEETAPAAATANAPNFVFIFTDDLGYGDLACFGATDIATPNLDKMANGGIKFTEFYSASPVCSPSRAGLLTGRLPQRMGINGVFFPTSLSGMPTDEITIAEVLKDKGYATGCVGKWHLGHMERFLPLQRGFDYYYGIPYSNDMESVVYLKGNEVDSFAVNQRYTTKTYTREAVDFIDQHKTGPFYLYLAHNMPHVPIYASPEFEGTSDRGLYGDVIQEIDWSVGQILDKLEQEGLMENTLVVFSSDNGPWLVMEDHGGSAGPLREGKMYVFEGGMRVPTLAYWPGTIPEGTVYEEMATQMDWFPTFAHLAGAEVPQDRPIDGEDISAVLKGEGSRKGENYLFWNGYDLRAYRKGKWKVKKPFEGFEGAIWKNAVPAHDTLLFDIDADPGEQKNLFVQQPEKARELLSEMQALGDSMRPLPDPIPIRSAADNSHYEYLANKRKGKQ